MGYAVDGDAAFKTNPHATYCSTRHAMDRLAGGDKLLVYLSNCACDTIAGVAGVGMIVDEYGNGRHGGSLFQNSDDVAGKKRLGKYGVGSIAGGV
jgi:hypothetical protein